MRIPICAIFDYKCKLPSWVVIICMFSDTHHLPVRVDREGPVEFFACWNQVQRFLHFFVKNTMKNCTWHRYVKIVKDLRNERFTQCVCVKTNLRSERSYMRRLFKNIE